MSKTTLVVLIYIIGILLGAFFLDIWGIETSMKKGFLALGWTALFLVGLFWPIGVKSNRRSPIWYGLTGIYLYLFPIYGALFPIAIFSALLFGGSIFIVYIASIIAFFLMRLSTGLNSLYFVFHLLLIGLSIAKLYSLRGITLFDRLNSES